MTVVVMILYCPLCRSGTTVHFHEDRHRRYLQCLNCELVFVPSEYFLSAEAEKAEYDLHENSPDDPGYRRFLSRAYLPVHERLAPASTGLDFGSGPGPTLSVMFAEAGHRMSIYDPFYAPDLTVFQRQYDFITATEVVEHLHCPGAELDRLWPCLKSGGVLGIMTKLVIDHEAFARWHYKDDLTHVCFYSRQTFLWLAGYWQAGLVFEGQDVIILEKPALVTRRPTRPI
jgi:hypothetical protein